LRSESKKRYSATNRNALSPNIFTSHGAMKAGIIAAGDGSRLKSEGVTVPKPLVLVDGVPLIERLIATFIRHNVTEVVCIVNEYSLDVKKFIESRCFSVPITFVVKTTPSSMHSLFALAPHLLEGKFLLSTVDAIFNEEEFALFLNHAQQQSAADGTLAVTNFIDDENPLYVQMDDAQRIRSFSKSEHSPWITGGLYSFHPRIFKEIDAAMEQKIERLRNFLGHLLSHGYSLEGFPFSKIIDVDHVHDIHVAEELLRAH
jgi:NDP-sugar pyrophosphorylase family protein